MLTALNSKNFPQKFLKNSKYLKMYSICIILMCWDFIPTRPL